MESFDKSKTVHLDKLYLPDKSRKGNVDKPIKNLIDEINKLKNYFTTSSCSGRTLILADNKKRHKVKWFYVNHNKINLNTIRKILINAKEETKKIIWFKYESFILHVACRDINAALNLIKLAKRVGLKRSGIITHKKTKTMVEILSNEQLEIPIAKNNKIIITNDFLKLLIIENNKKLKKSHQKIKQLENEIKKINKK
jgi:tRNA wybutosine-synthesizing protein 3